MRRLISTLLGLVIAMATCVSMNHPNTAFASSSSCNPSRTDDYSNHQWDGWYHTYSGATTPLSAQAYIKTYDPWVTNSSFQRDVSAWALVDSDPNHIAQFGWAEYDPGYPTQSSDHNDGSRTQFVEYIDNNGHTFHDTATMTDSSSHWYSVQWDPANTRFSFFTDNQTYVWSTNTIGWTGTEGRAEAEVMGKGDQMPGDSVSPLALDDSQYYDSEGGTTGWHDMNTNGTPTYQNTASWTGQNYVNAHRLDIWDYGCPHDPVGVIAGSNAWGESSITGNWTQQSTNNTSSQVARAGNRIGWIQTDVRNNVAHNDFWLSDSLGGTAVEEWDDARSIALGGSYMGVVDLNFNFQAKVGTNDGWTLESNNADHIAISSNYLVMKYYSSGNYYALAKTGLSGAWSTQNGPGVTAVTASSNAVGYVMSGYGYAREGNGGTEHTECGPSVTAFDVSTNYMACIDSSGLRAKQGFSASCGTTCGWITPALANSSYSAQAVTAGDYGVAYVDSHGDGYDMGGISTYPTPWWQEFSGGSGTNYLGKT